MKKKKNPSCRQALLVPVFRLFLFFERRGSSGPGEKKLVAAQ